MFRRSACYGTKTGTLFLRSDVFVVLNPSPRRGTNSYSINVAYELVGAMSKGISQVRGHSYRRSALPLKWNPQGALVHFSEQNLKNSSSTQTRFRWAVLFAYRVRCQPSLLG